LSLVPLINISMAYKGRFKPENPAKYKGNPTNIIYRSLWERHLMVYLDKHPDVIQWNSEEFFIPYKSPLDKRYHRYYPDFWVKKKNKDGTVETTVIEVKPKAQTAQPIKNEKHPRRFAKQVKTYAVNVRKWEAAKEFCDDRKWKFQILTEDNLF